MAVRLLILVLGVSWWFGLAACSTPPKTGLTIGVNQFIHHPNLDEFFAGFSQSMESWSRERDLPIAYSRHVANGDTAVALQIARQLSSQRVDLILALATPSAQASVRGTSGVPIVFGAITDPVGAGLVASLEHPGGLATGTTDVGPFEKQFELVKQLLPTARRVGIIRNPGEINSVASMRVIDAVIAKLGFEKVEVPVSNTGEVINAARAIVATADFFFIPPDNTVLSGLPAIVTLAESRKVPVFVTDEGSVALGAVATIGINYFESGKVAGRMAGEILGGKHPSIISVVAGGGEKLVFNVAAAERQGVKIPPYLLESATILGR